MQLIKYIYLMNLENNESILFKQPSHRKEQSDYILLIMLFVHSNEITLKSITVPILSDFSPEKYLKR